MRSCFCCIFMRFFTWNSSKSLRHLKNQLQPLLASKVLSCQSLCFREPGTAKCNQSKFRIPCETCQKNCSSHLIQFFNVGMSFEKDSDGLRMTVASRFNQSWIRLFLNIDNFMKSNNGNKFEFSASPPWLLQRRATMSPPRSGLDQRPKLMPCDQSMLANNMTFNWYLLSNSSLFSRIYFCSKREKKLYN